MLISFQCPCRWFQEAYPQIANTPGQIAVAPCRTHRSIGCEAWRRTKDYSKAIHDDSTKGRCSRRPANTGISCPCHRRSKAS